MSQVSDSIYKKILHIFSPFEGIASLNFPNGTSILSLQVLAELSLETQNNINGLSY